MIDSALVTGPADSEREKAPVDGVESSVSDAAQQLSAWACVRTFSEPEPGSVDPCIGQSPLPEQQAMRASGEACQPAHSAHPAAASARATTKAAMRLNSSSTTLGCTGATRVSMYVGNGCTKMHHRSRRCGSHAEPCRQSYWPALTALRSGRVQRRSRSPCLRRPADLYGRSPGTGRGPASTCRCRDTCTAERRSQ